MKNAFFIMAFALFGLHVFLISVALIAGQAHPANILLYGKILLDVEKHIPIRLSPHETDIQGASWSPDGHFILMTIAGASTDESAAWVLMANGQQRQLISNTGYQYVWSPDSTQIAYLNWLDQGKMALHIYDLKTQQSRWLFNYQAYGSDIVWSPDGRYITLTMRQWERNRVIPDIWVINANTGTLEYEFKHATTPVWSADNRWLAMTRFAADERGIFLDQIPYVVEMTTGNATSLNSVLPSPVSPVSGYEYTMSPDGHYLTVRVVAIVPELHVLAITAADEWEYRLTLKNVRYPQWSPDGAWLKYEQYEAGETHFYIMRPDGSEKHWFGTMPYGEIGAYRPPVWSPDSRFLVNLRQGKISYLLDSATAKMTILCYCLAGNGQWKP